MPAEIELDVMIFRVTKRQPPVERFHVAAIAVADALENVAALLIVGGERRQGRANGVDLLPGELGGADLFVGID